MLCTAVCLFILFVLLLYANKPVQNVSVVVVELGD